MIKKIVLLSIVLISLNFSTTAQVIAIKAGKLADPETGTTLTNQVILVEGKKITAIGNNLSIPSDAKIIDLSALTVLPGVFDTHTHLCSTFNFSQDAGDVLLLSLRNRTGYRSIQGVVHAREMLEAGFTTVRDLGNAGNYADIDLRQAIKEGLVPGPTMLAAGRIIAPFGGQFSIRVEKPVLDNPEYLFADTRDEMRKAIRENVYYGANVIKIVVDNQRYIYSSDDIKFVIEEATKMGLKVAAHCQTKQGGHNAAEAGVASIEHNWSLTKDEYDLMKKRDVVLVSTDGTVKVKKEWMKDEAAARKDYQRGIQAIKTAHESGVKLAFGTDVMVDIRGETRGTLAMSYIECFVDAGIPTKTIFQALTINAAKLLGIESERGLLRPGMAADIIATPENPLDNILTLKQVKFVMKDGKIIKKNE